MILNDYWVMFLTFLEYVSAYVSVIQILRSNCWSKFDMEELD